MVNWRKWDRIVGLLTSSPFSSLEAITVTIYPKNWVNDGEKLPIVSEFLVQNPNQFRVNVATEVDWQ